MADKLKTIVLVTPLAGNGRDFNMYDYLMNELENKKIKARVQEVPLTPALKAALEGKTSDGLYMLVLEGDVEPTIHGPYETANERDQAAGDWRNKYGDGDGIYTLTVEKGEVDVGTYSGAHMEKLALAAEERKAGKRGPKAKR